MDELDDGLWRTLARIYTVILACGVCVPATTAIPVLVGLDSFFVLLVFGVVGLGLAGGVTYLVDVQLDAAAAQRFTEAPDGEPTDRPGDAAGA
ncbi:hypothetical protein [Salinigranum halophilum]|uniref:hypothetical protein n=1 Tax=Salinigranum halophilum TaxID=2565931 RepID=UPI0010A7E78E|nr:hypothetical protein [Salinigranum halophilum]